MKTKSIFLISGLFYSSFCIALPSGMIVTSQHLATKVGQSILNQGGNAIDAAVAVGYALSVVEPCCGNIGGGGFMLIHLKNNQNLVINFREKAPLLIRKELFYQNGKWQKNKIRNGYLSVAVPGTVMGLNTALEKLGTLSLKQILSPAIKLAEHGFILKKGDIETLQDSWDTLKLHPSVTAIFAKHGHMLRIGERLIQHDLANSLKMIAQHGTSAFYQGKIANAIVTNSKNQGGILTKKDFLTYNIEIQKPIHCFYRGYEVLSVPPPSSGGTVLCEMLNILEKYPLSKWGYHQAKSTHYTIEAMRFAYRDRALLGDPNYVNNPVNKLLSAHHTKVIQKKIHPLKANHSERPHTTHYVVADKEGNVVSVTYTLNGYFGAQVIAKPTGIFLNNEMDDFTLAKGISNEYALTQGEANFIQPGKRPLSSMTPTIILKNKQFFMALGAPGGSTIPTQVLATIQNVIDYHFNLKKAVDAPRYHMQWLPDVVFIEPNTFVPKVRFILKKMGYRFKMGSPFGTKEWGAVAAILFDQKRQQLIGAIDRRRPEGLVLRSYGPARVTESEPARN